jgi:acetyl-CoA carboxylase biotin carboxyl carrier protein
MIIKGTPRRSVSGLDADDLTSAGSAWPEAPFGPSVDAAELDVVLAAVRYNALALHEHAVRPPSRVRVAAGDIVVELAWAEGVEAGPERATVVPDLPRPRQRPGLALVADEPANGQLAVDAAVGHPASANGIAPHLAYITAPSVGVFYHAPEPGAAPFVQVGDRVTARQQVGILEVMKLMIPVETETAGRIVEVCQPNAASVEYGQRLFAVDQTSEA